MLNASSSKNRLSRRAARSAGGRRTWRGGNAVLETALVLPILLSLTFGSVEYGYALFVKHAMEGAAREGARAAIVAGANSTTVQNAVDAAMQSAGFNQTKYTRPVTIEMLHDGTYSTGWTTAAPGDGIRVTVQANWGTIGVDVLPTWLGGIDDNKTFSTAVIMRKEG